MWVRDPPKRGPRHASRTAPVTAGVPGPAEPKRARANTPRGPPAKGGARVDAGAAEDWTYITGPQSARAKPAAPWMPSLPKEPEAPWRPRDDHVPKTNVAPWMPQANLAEVPGQASTLLARDVRFNPNPKAKPGPAVKPKPKPTPKPDWPTRHWYPEDTKGSGKGNRHTDGYWYQGRWYSNGL